MDTRGAYSGTVFFLVLVVSQSVLGHRKIEPKEKWMADGQSELKESLRVIQNYGVAKNVILFLGDGMGVSTVTAMRIHKGQKAGNPGEETVLNFEKFPAIALAKTYNTDKQVPDSAGTGTAYMTGVKTRRGVIAYDDTVTPASCKSTRPEAELTSMLNWSEDKGKSTGIVTTSRITHASPASCYAKSAIRSWEDDSDLPSYDKGNCKDIAAQLIERGRNISVILGGGRARMTPETMVDLEYSYKKGYRKDGRNLPEEWKADKVKRGKEAAYVWNKEDFDKVDTGKTDFLMGLFERSHMQYELDRISGGKKEPSLAEMTRKAIKMLQKNDKGYFLFVEGARIDHGHHSNKAQYAIEDGLAFEAAIQEGIDLTDENDTLIIVTADHSHVFALAGYPSRGNPLFDTVDGYVAKDKKPYTSIVYGNGPGFKIDSSGRADITNVDVNNPSYRQQAAVPMSSETHGGEDVTIYARGPMSHLFHGTHEQNYIAHVMGYAACVGPNLDHCTKPESIRFGSGLDCKMAAYMSAQGAALQVQPGPVMHASAPLTKISNALLILSVLSYSICSL